MGVTPGMTAAEFRSHGRAVIDWIGEYLQTVSQRDVQSTIDPGVIASMLPAAAPDDPESFDAILHDLDEIILPGITHWQSPRFFAYFPSNASPPSVLGDLVSSGLGVQGMLWSTSPACTELETRMVDWMRQLLGLPEAFASGGSGGGVLQDTASSSTLCAMVAARDKALGGEVNQTGILASGRQLVAYTSTQSHSSIEKAARIAGIGADHLRLIDVDDAYAMQPAALEAAIIADIAAGHVPFFCSATLGTTASGAFDPVEEIGEICRRHNLWLHVDGAMFGIATVCPEWRWINAGLLLADSYTVNPHKWMLTNFDCNCFFVREKSWLLSAMSIMPEYLRNEATEAGAVIDYRDWHIPLGRRFRSLKLWFVLRTYGIEGIRAMVRHHVEMAQWFAEQVVGHGRLEIAAPHPLSLVCFTHSDGNEATRLLLEHINATGRVFLTHCELDGRYVIRMAIGQYTTTQADVQEAWDVIQGAVK
jgi:aromatic-L-amino-acid decarboxylase